MSYTKRNSVVSSITLGSGVDANDAVVEVYVSAQIQQRVVNDQTPAEVADLPPKTLTAKMLTGPASTATYTAAGKSATGIQLAALNRQFVLDEATRQGL